MSYAYTKKYLFAAAPQTTRGHSVKLGADPKGKNFLYTNGRTVIIRDIEHPEIASAYTEHSSQVTVARYSPSGFYICSGDANGNIRIWDTTQEEHILKSEYRPLADKICDIQWDSESKRIIVVGDGKEKFGHAFLFDTGSSVGNITGHSKVINACSIRSKRPFRAVTCSDDMTINFYNGVPYKFARSHNNLHTGFVQDVSFSPNGDLFASAGSDGKIFVFDGSTGDMKCELSTCADNHKGGIYSLNWSPDSTQILTSSGDCTVKLWDVASQSVKTTFNVGNSVNDQQLGNLWQNDWLLSVSLGGNINYLDKNTGSICKVLKGHVKGITSICKTDNSETFYTGSYDGRICKWDDSTVGEASYVEGAGHSNQIQSMTCTGSTIETVSMDNSNKSIDISSNSFNGNSISFEGLPKTIVSNKSNDLIVATSSEIVVIKNKSVASKLSISYEANTVDVSPDSTEVAVGAADNKVYFYSFDGTNLTAKDKLEQNRGAITAIKYSPNGELIAVADTNRAIYVFDVKERSLKYNQWVFHNARVNSINWSDDGLHAVSTSLDTGVIVWSIEKPMKKIQIKNAHQENSTGAVFLNNNTIASVGQDACIRVWNLTY